MLLDAEPCPDLTIDPMSASMLAGLGGMISVPRRQTVCRTVSQAFAKAPHDYDFCTSLGRARSNYKRHRLYTRLISRYLYESLS